ncbi:MAG TPA: PDZ domain-containing protein, partial [Longimicrobiales bacterium]|nr:PDZ domain-containing protein [Longimicrobiales bacterium]
GRYALHEFAKNVYDVSAVDGAGRALEVERPSPYGWDVVGHDGTVRFTYTLYANHADGTYAGVDSTHAHYNMPAAFVYARGLEARPVRITFRPIHDWRIATQLQPTDDPNTFVAPDLQYFLDSPTELSDFTLREWRAGPRGEAVIRIALHHLGTEEEADAYAEMAEAVVAEQAAVFGGYPEFDYGTYTFLADYLPWVYGDGMEHRNSTILTSSLSLEEGADRVLGTLAHEAFHAWNMERLRDDALEPFAFQRANMSENLWFGEGFTSYYDALTRLRAGLMSLEQYAGDLGRGLDYVIQSPAREYRGPADMSRMAPFVDAATAVDEVAFANTFVSYYTWGEVVAFGLDMLLRQRYEATLDDYMRLLWDRFGRHQADRRPTRPYDMADLQQALADVTGDAAFAEEFFDRYIRTGNVLEYAALVEPAGLVLRRSAPDRGTLGLRGGRFVAPSGASPGGMRITAPLHPGSAAARAGIASGDLVLEIAGTAVTDAAALERALDGRAPGDTVMVTFLQTGATKTVRARLLPDPTLELVPFEAAGRPVTDEVRAFREAWAGSRAN